MANMKTVGLIVAIAVIAILIAATVGLKGKAAIATNSKSNSVTTTTPANKTPANNTEQGLNISESQFVSLVGSGIRHSFNSSNKFEPYNTSTNSSAVKAIFSNITNHSVFGYVSVGQYSNVSVIEYEITSNKPKNLMNYLSASNYSLNLDSNFNATNVTIDNLTYDYASANLSRTNENYTTLVSIGEKPEYTDLIGTKGKYVVDVLILGTQIDQNKTVNFVLNQIP